MVRVCLLKIYFMREKILAKLQAKFAGLSTTMLGLLADKLAAKTTTEDQIQGNIDELDNLPIPITEFAAFLQREGDRRATEAQATRERTLRERYDLVEKGTPPPTPPTPPAPGNPADPNDGIRQDLAKALKRLDEIDKREQRQILQNDFIKKLSEKGIPTVLAKGRSIETAEQLDAVVAEVESDYNAVKQELTNKGLGQMPAPVGGTEQPATVIDADIASWGAKNAPKTV